MEPEQESEMDIDLAPQPPGPDIGTLPYRCPGLIIEHRSDGSVLLSSPHPPASRHRSVAHLFEERAIAHPSRDFIMRRSATGSWEGLTYASMRTAARSIARWMLGQDLPGTGGVMVLTGNSIEHAAVMLAGYYSGTPVTALSQAFSTASADFGKLLHCFSTIRPKAIFVQSGQMVRAAVDALRAVNPDLLVIAAEAVASDMIAYATLHGPGDDSAVARALTKVGPDTVAKYLFTSGSTGLPKAVPQTHLMMTAMIAARHGLMRDPEARLPAFAIDWMPWSHLSAGNIGFNHNIWAGGTLFIDDGRPTRGQFSETLGNMLELQPATFSSAPIAFELLASALEEDPAMSARFFSNLQWMAYGGAALSQDLADRLERLSLAATGRRTPIVTTYGATEVQGVTTVYWPTERVGLLGLPLPEVLLKLAPVGAKLEVRVKGPTVMTGYHNNPEANETAFDEEGYYRLGDAARLVDVDEPLRGLAFDGRISEDFKLNSGTWVSVGTLRTALIEAASPAILDAVLTGHDQAFVGALLWLGPAADDDRLAMLKGMIARFNAVQGGTSRRIARFLVLDEPPSVLAGEITEKGYVNQRAVLDRRTADVARLYSRQPDDGVVIVD
jgi:feruloyl-CoA synthase